MAYPDANGPPDPLSPDTPRERPSRRWVWYFVILALLTVTSVSILIAFNLKQQLNPEELARNRQLWDTHKPSDYDLEYTKEGRATGKFEVQVRGGKVVRVLDDGRPLERWQYPYHSMDALFEFIEDDLKHDQEPGAPRVFVIGQFDPEDGHLLHYVRRISGTSDRIEITTQLRRVAERR